jgi:phage gp36-like protein
MGSYANTTNMKARFPGFPQSSTTFDTVLSDNITRAESVVNASIARRYGLPFTTVPPYIITIAEDLSAGYAYRSSFMRDSHNTSEWQEELVDKAMDMLKEIKDGDIDLVDTSGNIISERSTRTVITSNTEDYTLAFGLDTSTSWRVDPDRLSDIATDRF